MILSRQVYISRHYLARCSLPKPPFAIKPVPGSRSQPLASFTMEAQQGHSKACCNIPPIISKGYEMKGKYEDIGGLKNYVTGPADSPNAILMIYDIFGYFPQSLQGADILATSDPDHQFQVFIPDFFEGNPAKLEWYPPVTPEQKQALGAWFPPRVPATGVPKIPKILADIEAKYGKKNWAALGLCWGGKVVTLTAGTDTPWKVAAQVHPAMLDPADAAKVTVPMVLLGSADEAAEDVERFADQIHGFMGSRSDLENERVRGEYRRAYGIVLDFFAKHI